MKSQFADELEQEILETMPLDTQINVLYEVLDKVLEEGTIKARIVKFKLQKHVKSEDIYKRAYALEIIVSDGKGLNMIPDESNVHEVLESINNYMGETLAKNYVKGKIEKALNDLIDKISAMN